MPNNNNPVYTPGQYFGVNGDGVVHTTRKRTVNGQAVVDSRTFVVTELDDGRLKLDKSNEEFKWKEKDYNVIFVPDKA